MSKAEALKEKIKSGQEKLNELLKRDEKDILSLEETAAMSRELDKLIVEFLRLQK